MSSTKSSADCAPMSIGGREGRGPRRSRTWLPPGQSAEPVPDRLLRPDAHSELMTFRMVTSVQVRHLPAVGLFASVAGSTSLLELLGDLRCIVSHTSLTAFPSPPTPSRDLFSAGLYK